MSCHVSSIENRFYAALEPGFGVVSSITEDNRLPGVKLAASQKAHNIVRRDKTGSRTFAGLPDGIRKTTTFEFSAYLTSWAYDQAQPAYSPLVQAALGGAPAVYSGGSIGSLTGSSVQFTVAHGLSVGQGVSSGGELRFVAAVIDDVTVLLNAPFTGDQAAGWPVDRTVTFGPASELPSVSVFDYWSPQSAVQRILAGAAVDRMEVDINGDFHEFKFAGFAKDLIDNSSFLSGQAGLTEFPAEPTFTEMAHSVVPGNLGQAWLGSVPEQFFTVTGAKITVDNNLEMRAREFGMTGPRCVVPGMRSVTASFNLYEKPDAATQGLYQAARQRSPISVMLQLGQQSSQLCGVYMTGVVPEIPEFSDDGAQLEWRFSNCRAQGIADDEIFVAFA